MPIHVDTISNSDGTGGPVLTGLTTVTGALEVSTDLTVTGFTTVSGSAGVVGILTADGFDATGVTTIASFGGVQNISAGTSITVGDTFILDNAVGLGLTSTTGRDAGVGTVTGTLIYNETDYAVQVYDGTQWVNGLASPFSATGGTKDTTSRSGYAVHTFTGDGTFTVAAGSKPMTCEYVVVGGGGGAPGGFPNGACGGGGGAGGHQSGSTLTVTAGDYTIQVGGGGAGVTGNSSKPDTIGPMKGTPSFITNPGISSITALGGGGGCGYGYTVGDIQTDGVCGSGGGGNQNPTNSAGSGTSGQGNSGGLGGSSAPGPVGGGGGGGAGGAGANGGTTSPPSGTGGQGGNGEANSITGSPVTRAGGGGGGGGWYHTGSPSYAGGLAGPGGGGAGGSGNGGGQGGAGSAGTANTGGGGGAGGAPGPGGGNSVGAAGGSGIVIIAYPTS